MEAIFCKQFNTLYLTRFRTYKIATWTTPNKNLGGEGASEIICRFEIGPPTSGAFIFLLNYKCFINISPPLANAYLLVIISS